MMYSKKADATPVIGVVSALLCAFTGNDYSTVVIVFARLVGLRFSSLCISGYVLLSAFEG